MNDMASRIPTKFRIDARTYRKVEEYAHNTLIPTILDVIADIAIESDMLSQIPAEFFDYRETEEMVLNLEDDANAALTSLLVQILKNEI